MHISKYAKKPTRPDRRAEEKEEGGKDRSENSFPKKTACINNVKKKKKDVKRGPYTEVPSYKDHRGTDPAVRDYGRGESIVHAGVGGKITKKKESHNPLLTRT